jgi:hypothetical protein
VFPAGNPIENKGSSCCNWNCMNQWLDWPTDLSDWLTDWQKAWGIGENSFGNPLFFFGFHRSSSLAVYVYICVCVCFWRWWREYSITRAYKNFDWQEFLPKYASREDAKCQNENNAVLQSYYLYGMDTYQSTGRNQTSFSVPDELFYRTRIFSSSIGAVFRSSGPFCLRSPRFSIGEHGKKKTSQYQLLGSEIQIVETRRSSSFSCKIIINNQPLSYRVGVNRSHQRTEDRCDRFGDFESCLYIDIICCRWVECV